MGSSPTAGTRTLVLRVQSRIADSLLSRGEEEASSRSTGGRSSVSRITNAGLTPEDPVDADGVGEHNGYPDARDQEHVAQGLV